MDLLKKFFPTAFTAKDLTAFIVNVIIFIIVGAICGVVLWLFSLIPIIGVLFIAIGALIELYVVIGIVLAALVFTKVIE